MAKRCREAHPEIYMTTMGLLITRKIFRTMLKDSPKFSEAIRDIDDELERRRQGIRAVRRRHERTKESN